jgi:hypothetical protein
MDPRPAKHGAKGRNAVFRPGDVGCHPVSFEFPGWRARNLGERHAKAIDQRDRAASHGGGCEKMDREEARDDHEPV